MSQGPIEKFLEACLDFFYIIFIEFPIWFFETNLMIKISPELVAFSWVLLFIIYAIILISVEIESRKRIRKVLKEERILNETK